jgi:peroxiredoxin
LPSTIETLHRRYRDRGLEVWAVNLKEPRSRVAEWVGRTGLTVPVLLDADGAVARAYRVTGTPTVVLVNRAGRLVGRAVGTRDWLGDKSRALFSALLAGPAPVAR